MVKQTAPTTTTTTNRNRTTIKATRRPVKLAPSDLRFTRHNVKQITHYLTNICSSSGVCIAFGKEDKLIKTFFNDFVDFTYLTKIKRIGDDSVNGVVYDLEYIRENYKSNAILKTTPEKPVPLDNEYYNTTDNLIYEYLVGKYINNHFYYRYPLFVETYGVLQKVNKNIKDLNTFTKNVSVVNTKNIEKLINTSCYDPSLMSILIQHIKDGFTLNSIFTPSQEMNTLIENELLCILFQIYYVLNKERRFFTHYDLHTGNVLIYEPVKNSYIEYHYHHEGQVVSFKSRYVVKIIDYGRCYFPEAKNTYDIVCKQDTCNKYKTKCGYKMGYNWLEPPMDERDLQRGHYIYSLVPNMSYDLWLLEIMKDIHNKNAPYLDYIRKHLIYENPLVEYKKNGDRKWYAGTPENDNMDFAVDGSIKNVNDAFMYLKSVMTTMTTQIQTYQDELNNSSSKLGDLHIYGNRPMEYAEEKFYSPKQKMSMSMSVPVPVVSSPTPVFYSAKTTPILKTRKATRKATRRLSKTQRRI